MVISLKNKEGNRSFIVFSGENRIALDEQELYLLSDLLELEIVWKPLFSGVGEFRKYTKRPIKKPPI